MDIYIIDYTDQQFSELTEEQLLKVKDAQLKMERLNTELSEKLEKERYSLIQKGIYNSSIWNVVQTVLSNACDREVQLLRDSLLFYLRFSGKQEGDAEQAGYLLDYALTMEERFDVVQIYYEETYEDATERFEAFKEDKVARRYLGEYYAPLYDYFLELTYEEDEE